MRHWRHGHRNCSAAPSGQAPTPLLRRAAGAGLDGESADRATIMPPRCPAVVGHCPRDRVPDSTNQDQAARHRHLAFQPNNRGDHGSDDGGLTSQRTFYLLAARTRFLRSGLDCRFRLPGLFRLVPHLVLLSANASAILLSSTRRLLSHHLPPSTRADRYIMAPMSCLVPRY